MVPPPRSRRTLKQNSSTVGGSKLDCQSLQQDNADVREELWTPLNPSVTKALKTYFPERQAQGGHLGDPDDRFIRQEFRTQGMSKIQALCRAWRRQGDRVLWQAHSTCLRDDRSHGCSAVEIELLNRQYLQLCQRRAKI